MTDEDWYNEQEREANEEYWDWWEEQ